MTGSSLPLPSAAGHVRVFRAAEPSYVALLVEGASDVELLQPWTRYRPVPLGGRLAVLAWVNELRTGGENGYVGLIDADCVRLQGTDERAPDVIVSDAHDLEGDVFRLPCLDRLLAPVDDALVSSICGGLSFREALLARAMPFGLLRWHFFRQRTPFEPHRLIPTRFIDPNTWVLNEQQLLSDAANALGVATTTLHGELDQLRGLGSDPWAISNGHDLIDILALALRGPLLARKRYPQAEATATALRLAVDSSYLSQLRVWRDLKAWELANAPFAICAV